MNLGGILRSKLAWFLVFATCWFGAVTSVLDPRADDGVWRIIRPCLMIALPVALFVCVRLAAETQEGDAALSVSQVPREDRVNRRLLRLGPALLLTAILLALSSTKYWRQADVILIVGALGAGAVALTRRKHARDQGLAKAREADDDTSNGGG